MSFFFFIDNLVYVVFINKKILLFIKLFYENSPFWVLG